MIQTINATTVNAKSAEQALVNAIDNATIALDGIARDPLAESLARLQEAAEAAQARLLAGRMRANALLLSALCGFQAFEAELNPATEDEAILEVPPVAELPAPVVAVAPEPETTPAPADEVVTATAANATEAEPAPASPLSPDDYVMTPAEAAAFSPTASRPRAKIRVESLPVAPPSPPPEGEPAQSIGDLTEEIGEASEANPGPHAEDAAEEPAPVAPKKGRGRKGRA